MNEKGRAARAPVRTSGKAHDERNNEGAVAVFPTRCSVANRGEIAIARPSPDACPRGCPWDSGTVGATIGVDLDPAAPTSAYTDEAVSDRRRARPQSASPTRSDSLTPRPERRARAKRIHPATALPRRECASSRVAVRRTTTWSGSAAARRRIQGKLGLEDRGAASGLRRGRRPRSSPGVTSAVASAERGWRRLVDDSGWPDPSDQGVLPVRAAGKGLQGRAQRPTRWSSSCPFESAREEARRYFSDPAVYVERYHRGISAARRGAGCSPMHNGQTSFHLGERDLARIQRRHQKLIEETALPGGRRALRGADRGRESRRTQRVPVGYRQRGGPFEGCSPERASTSFPRDVTPNPGRATVTESGTGLDLVPRARC